LKYSFLKSTFRKQGTSLDHLHIFVSAADPGGQSLFQNQ
jgi:hypothetical protein